METQHGAWTLQHSSTNAVGRKVWIINWKLALAGQDVASSSTSRACVASFAFHWHQISLLHCGQRDVDRRKHRREHPQSVSLHEATHIGVGAVQGERESREYCHEVYELTDFGGQHQGALTAYMVHNTWCTLYSIAGHGIKARRSWGRCAVQPDHVAHHGADPWESDSCRNAALFQRCNHWSTNCTMCDVGWWSGSISLCVCGTGCQQGDPHDVHHSRGNVGARHGFDHRCGENSGYFCISWWGVHSCQTELGTQLQRWVANPVGTQRVRHESVGGSLQTFGWTHYQGWKLLTGNQSTRCQCASEASAIEQVVEECDVGYGEEEVAGEKHWALCFDSSCRHMEWPDTRWVWSMASWCLQSIPANSAKGCARQRAAFAAFWVGQRHGIPSSDGVVVCTKTAFALSHHASGWRIHDRGVVAQSCCHAREVMVIWCHESGQLDETANRRHVGSWGSQQFAGTSDMGRF